MTPPLSLPPHLLPIAIGGALGAALRHAVNHYTAAAAPNHPYLATFLVNLAGSAALGALAAWLLHRPAALPRELELGLTIGLIGALTTYSTFATDAVKLVHDGRTATALAYVFATTIAALGLAAAAFFLVTKLLAAAPAGH